MIRNQGHGKGCGLVVRVLGLHAIAPGSKPVE